MKINCIVQSCRRPQNIPAIYAALRHQTVTCSLTLIDCATDPECEVGRIAKHFDAYFRVFHPNYGPCCRFIPALMDTESDYCCFVVDDHLPGKRMVESLLDCAEKLEGRFATIGMQGRNVVDGDLSGRRIMPSAEPVPTDCIVTSELVRRDAMPGAIGFRNLLLEINPNVSTFEDDLILCMGIQHCLGFASYVAPVPDSDSSWQAQRLPSPNALCARPNHRELRNEFVKTAIQAGWKSCR